MAKRHSRPSLQYRYEHYDTLCGTAIFPEAPTSKGCFAGGRPRRRLRQGTELSKHRGMSAPPLTLRLATKRDMGVIIHLLDEAAAWLRTKDTDQWAKPWRTEEDRRARISRDLRAGKTWIVHDGPTLVATFTADRGHNHQEIPVWPEWARQQLAVYVCRLSVHRSYAGHGLGAALLGWIGLQARQRYGAEWIRVDVWTTNDGLRSYYQRLGFQFCADSDDPGYPSGALFQKSTDYIELSEPALFHAEESGELS
jgi:ribosomal protein S18 acetylase RimI-like enzyme